MLKRNRSLVQQYVADHTAAKAGDHRERQHPGKVEVVSYRKHRPKHRARKHGEQIEPQRDLNDIADRGCDDHSSQLTPCGGRAPDTERDATPAGSARP